MPQFHVIEPDPYFLRAKNIQLELAPGTNIVFSALPTVGFNNFAITVSNYSGGSLSNINLLGSADNINYYSITQDIVPAGIATGATVHYEFTTTSHYLQVTIDVSVLSTIDAYLLASE